jgi:tetratricopeptide (TPR) repeat protein
VCVAPSKAELLAPQDVGSPAIYQRIAAVSPYNMDMQRLCLIGLLLAASLAMAQQTSPSQQPAPDAPAQQAAPAPQSSQQPPDAPDATKTQQQTDQTDQTGQADQQPEKPVKPKPGFKDLKHHFGSWCVGAPVNRCFDKQEDADAAESSAKKQKSGQTQPPVPENQPLPHSTQGNPSEPAADESSSRSTLVDLAPPDAEKNQPAEASDDVTEMHPYDPHKAAKDVEVGDYYFDLKNYPAAYSRYQEALLYKGNYALAVIGLARAAERLGKPDEARGNYEKYLQILPHGPNAPEATKALERLNSSGGQPPVARKH